jgi:hypothetical protein
MSTLIWIHTESTGWVEAEIDETLNPGTAGKILESLPIESRVRRWGEEVYFDISASAVEETSQIEMEIGDLAFWPAGNCFCIFFGRTPASIGEKPAAASPVNRFGKLTGDAKVFSSTKDDEVILVEIA